MNTKYILTALLFLCSLSVAGRSHTLTFGGGIALEALRDQGFSPLLYSGAGPTGLMGYKSTSDTRETVWLLSYGVIQTNNTFDRELTATSVGLLNLNFYTKDDKNLTWGWSNNNGFHHRLIDGFSNYNGRTDVFTSFGPAIQYSQQFTIFEQQFNAQVISHLQLIGFYLPSGYVSSYPRGFGYESYVPLRGFWESIYLFYPGGSWNTALWPSVEWNLATGNSLSLNYHYEYTRLSGAQMHERSTGIWFLTFNMKLK